LSGSIPRIKPDDIHVALGNIIEKHLERTAVSAQAIGYSNI